MSGETEDTPPCLAMHILRALVQESSLAYDIVPHLSAMLKVCVDNFSSTSWAIRNAALQVGPKIKKAKDDNELPWQMS